MNPEKSDILFAVEKLLYGFNKVEEIDPKKAEIENNILDNRVITLEGYFRYLEQDGIDLLKKIQDMAEGAKDE